MDHVASVSALEPCPPESKGRVRGWGWGDDGDPGCPARHAPRRLTKNDPTVDGSALGEGRGEPGRDLRTNYYKPKNEEPDG